MEYRNFTQFPSLAYEGLDQYEQQFHVAVLRMTLEICPDNSLKFAEDQTELVVVDEYYGEMNKSSVKQESDLVPFKPKCDVLFIGSAYAPGGKPASQFQVGIKITGSVTLDKRLVDTGASFWEKEDSDWNLTELASITSLPLQYEYAYGGECRIEIEDPAAKSVKEEFHLTPQQRQEHPDGQEQAPLAHTAYDRNPVGLGYTEEWYLDAIMDSHNQEAEETASIEQENKLPAPQILSPTEPLLEFGKHSAPEGFGVINKACQPRLKLAGTYDEDFIKSEAWLPEDFDFAYWNCAQTDMQIPYPQGTETIELINLTPSGVQDKQGDTVARFVLPGCKPYLLARFEAGEMLPIAFKIDTLIINTDEKNLTLVYRAVLPKEPTVRVLEARMMTKEEAEHHDMIKKQMSAGIDTKQTPVNGRHNG
jgi:hypothetical protein